MKKLMTIAFRTEKELKEFVNDDQFEVVQIILRQDNFTWILFYYG